MNICLIIRDLRFKREEITFPFQIEICFILPNDQIIKRNNQIFKTVVGMVGRGWHASIVTNCSFHTEKLKSKYFPY